MKRKLFLLVIVVSIGLYFFMPKKGSSVTEIMDKGTLISRQSLFEQYSGIYDDSITDLDQLTERSDAILKVKFVSRILDQNLSDSKCQIISIIKDVSEKLTENQTISIFEIFSISDKGIILQTPFAPMEENEEYYVFLKRIKEYEKPTYNLYSDYYGMYPLKELEIETLDNISSTTDFCESSDVKNTGKFLYVFDFETDYLKTYKAIYNEIRNNPEY